MQLSWNNVRSFLFLTMIISRGFFNEGGSIVKLVLVIHLRCTVDLCIYVVGEFLAVCGKDDRKMSPRNFIDYFWNLKSFEIFKFVLLFNFFFLLILKSTSRVKNSSNIYYMAHYMLIWFCFFHISSFVFTLYVLYINNNNV